jgi:hypothetical protein
MHGQPSASDPTWHGMAWHGVLQPIVAWALWMIVGTAFYAVRNDFGWSEGFYM